MRTVRELLDDCLVMKEEIDRFLDPKQNNWARFDPELGYLLKDCVIRDGMNHCFTFNQYANSGERRMIHYKETPCRINTYGNSFTQCHQVSDGETWQEYLAAHLGEPIRNFGIGGFGVFQAYSRMKREEAKAHSASYVILNVWTDDHYRSIDKWRWIRTGDFRRDFRKTRTQMFHANPWIHLRMNEHGEFIEVPNAYNTPGALYQLCDKDHIYEEFKDDVIVHLELARMGGEFDKTIVQQAADLLELSVNLNDAEAAAEASQHIHTAYALQASRHIVAKAREFTERQGKKLMVMTSYSSKNVMQALEGGQRFDQDFINYLKEHDFLHVDTLNMHVEDYQQYRLSPLQYVQRYYINDLGHYNPIGNHFYAFAVKDAMVQWLDPKPPAYVDKGVSASRLASWLAY